MIGIVRKKTTPTQAQDVKKYHEYYGMSYEDASREAEKLIKLGWFKNWDRLNALRHIMLCEHFINHGSGA